MYFSFIASPTASRTRWSSKTGEAGSANHVYKGVDGVRSTVGGGDDDGGGGEDVGGGTHSYDV